MFPLLGEAYGLELFSIWRKFTQSCAEKFSNKGFKSSFVSAFFSFFWFVFFLLIAKKKENERKKTFILFICSFFLFVAMQKEKTNQKRKTSYTKRNSKYFNGNFSATGCCKNCLKTQLFLIKATTGACRPRTPAIY